MTTTLEMRHLLFCYNNLREKRKRMNPFELGKHFGYLEAGLMLYGRLETKKDGDRTVVEVKLGKSDKWWKKDRKETYEEAIVRMIRKLFDEHKVEYQL